MCSFKVVDWFASINLGITILSCCKVHMFFCSILNSFFYVCRISRTTFVSNRKNFSTKLEAQYHGKFCSDHLYVSINSNYFHRPVSPLWQYNLFGRCILSLRTRGRNQCSSVQYIWPCILPRYPQNCVRVHCFFHLRWHISCSPKHEIPRRRKLFPQRPREHRLQQSS